MPFVLK